MLNIIDLSYFLPGEYFNWPNSSTLFSCLISKGKIIPIHSSSPPPQKLRI